ncbi:cbb3-type cytochrome oxidase assembly protein CcoS [Balneolales bacterium ANBcel1]|nr:cbb3-type cytochrome oxidase assembly protein CcoS [Balneolales bacterium ANBcel1]
MSFGGVILLLSSLLIIGGGLGLFLWAFFTGQFDRIQRGSMLPFDEEEPAGKRTDQIFKDDKNETKERES